MNVENSSSQNVDSKHTKAKAIKRMNKECPHDNVIDAGTFPKMKYVIETKENKPIPGLFVRYKRCEDCHEERSEVFQNKIDTKSQEHVGEKYIAREEYYTNGGALVQKDGFGNWYYNGEKMTGRRLKKKMQVMGDSFGDQEVSSNFKEIAYQARRQTDLKRYNKTKRLEELRDKW